jgi:hypothetical protein
MTIFFLDLTESGAFQTFSPLIKKKSFCLISKITMYTNHMDLNTKTEQINGHMPMNIQLTEDETVIIKRMFNLTYKH